MNISRAWLEAFLRRPLDAGEVAGRLAMLGATVDAIEPVHPGLGDIVVGLVEAVAPHPNADRLRVCTVDDGSPARRQVICGAPNVEAGKKYPFAPIGSTLPGGIAIEKRKLRGVVSEGMLCSARELGLGEDHAGILELDTDAAPGAALAAALPVGDQRLVVDVTPNRPDLLGHKGAARELAAGYGVPLRLPEIPGADPAGVPTPRRAEATEGTIGGVRVRIDDADGCRRFVAAVLRGVQVGPSPRWLAERIVAIGMRSINNVVDATNYVMFELAQPMHAYDVARLEGPLVAARRARPDERLVTLDDVPRILTDDMVVIADAKAAVGVAGVMGAAHVEVTGATTDLFLECAWFEPRRVRRARRRLGISSEASYRFERGVDLWNAPEAMRRCIEIIQATAGGTLEEPPLDLYPRPTPPPRVFLRGSRVAQVLGIELPWSELERTLSAVGATILSKPDDGRIAVDVPGWRPDLAREIDLVEEIARIYGYDNFPVDLRPYRPGTVPDAVEARAEDRLRDGLTAWGLLEAMTLPFGPAEGADSVRVVNPLSAEDAWLRQRLVPGLVRQVEANWAAGTRAVRLFEVGHVFRQADPGRPPAEESRVAAVITGEREPAHWTTAGHTPVYDEWDLQGLFRAAVALAQPDASVQVEGNSWVAITSDGRTVGRAERLPADAPPWAAPVYGFELSLVMTPEPPLQVRPLPGTPASDRDLALVLPAGVAAARILEVVRRAGGTLLETADILSEYRGSGLAAGTRSLAVHLVFRAADRTLQRDEVEQTVGRILKVLERELGVHLREA